MNKIFKVVWNEKKGCNVVTSEKGKSTCRFRGSARLAAMAILGLTVITSGMNTASAEGATTTVGTIEVKTSNNLTFGGGILLPGTSLTAMDSSTYSISGTIANPTSMAFNGSTNTTAYIYANGQLIPEHSFVANGTEQATSTRNITKMWNDSGTVDGNGNYIHATSPVKKAAQISPVETKQTVISSPGNANKGTIKTEVLGTKTTTTTGKTVTISKLSDNLAFANIGGLAEAGASTMASYDLMLDDITQAALNEHAKAINTLTELAVDAQNDKQTAFVDANGNKVVKTTDSTGTTEGYYLESDIDPATGKARVGASTVAHSDIHVSLLDASGSTTTPTKLSNVANGTVAANSKDAVNGGQLFDVKQNITNLTNTVNSGLTFKGDTGTQFNRALGTTVNVIGGTTGNGTTNNVVVTANGTDTLTVKLAENIDLGTNGSVTTGKTKISNAGLTSKDAAGNTTVVNGSGLSFTDNTGAATGPSITKDGINAGNKTISNVATAVNGTDAVNLTQVRNMISGIGGGAHSKVTAGNNIKVTESLDTATNGKVFNVALKDSISVTNVTTTDAAGNTTVTNGNGVTITGASSPTNPGKIVSLTTDGLNNGCNQIHNVAPGTSATDAATVGQVQATLSGVNSAFNGLDSKINTTGANAAALAGLKPLQYDPLEPTQIMAAYGHYHNKSAVAVGVAHFTDESTMFHAGVTLDDENNMFNVGVTKKVGSSTAKKEIPERYKGGPISSIYVMNDEITALKEENARIKQENEETKAKLAMVMAKLGL